MLRTEQGGGQIWDIHAVVELDGVDFASGVLKFEAKGANALNYQAAGYTTNRSTRDGPQIVEAGDITRHCDGAKGIKTNLERVGVEFGRGMCSIVVDGLISNKLRLVEPAEAREPMDPVFNGDGGE